MYMWIIISMWLFFCWRNNRGDRKRRIRGIRIIALFGGSYIAACFSSIFGGLFIKCMPALIVPISKYIVREDIKTQMIILSFIVFSVLSWVFGLSSEKEMETISNIFMGFAVGHFVWLIEKW